MRALHIPNKPTAGSSTTPTLPLSVPLTPLFHNTTPASTSSSSSTAKQPRLRASCDGCFLAKVKCTKSRPVCSRCLAVGLVCRYSPSSRSLGSHKQTHTDKEGGGKGKKSRVRRNGGTAVLASTMSEESCAWLAQQGPLTWGANVGGDTSSAAYEKGRMDVGFEWDLASLSMLDQGYNGSLTSEWMTPESQGWMQFACPAFGNESHGDHMYWQTMREVNSPFSIGSSEVDEVPSGELIVNHAQWMG